MGSVAHAVVEFDEAVQAPWRPPLTSGAGRRAQLCAVPEPARQPSAPGTGVRASSSGANAPTRRPPSQARRPVPAGSAVRRTSPAGLPAGVRAEPGVRLTRRARRLGAVLGLTVGVAVGSWVGSAVAGGDEGLRLAGESSVVVQGGDTLWSIAATVAAEGDDVRAVIAEIRELNELVDASLVPGQVLVLP